MPLPREWNIPPPARICAATAKPFLDGQPFISTLRHTPTHQLIRTDYSLEGWQKTQHTPQEIASRWQSTYRTRRPPQPQPPHDIETLLRQLLHTAHPADAPTCYLLCVMLERKKRLKLIDTLQRGQRRILIYQHTKTGEHFPIEDPRLQLDQLPHLQQRIRQLLQHPTGSLPLHGKHPSPTCTPPRLGWRQWLRRHCPVSSPCSWRIPRLPRRPLRGKTARGKFHLLTYLCHHPPYPSSRIPQHV